MMHSYADYRTNKVFDTDILIIGTGAGGAVVGAELAEAGFDVTFVEEGSYVPTSSFSPYSSWSVSRLYRDGGATVILGRPPIPYMEGRAVGGSTVINGGMCYRAPEDILGDWQKVTGSRDLGPEAMESLFERVEKTVHAKRHHVAAVGNDSRLMAAGARHMGWKVEINSRNQESCVGANNCVLGCPTGAKQSTLVTYMPRAMQAGARLLTEVRIHRLRIQNGRCVGAVGRAVHPETRKADTRVEIRARAVVVACGGVQTPNLLLRHRVGRPSGQLGRNFLCHPNAKVLAVYPHEVNAWQGVNQWCQIREFHNEGILFAENFVPPSALAASIPYHGQKAWELMQRYNHMVMSGVLVEDSKPGRIHRGLFGTAMPVYNITDYDHQRFLKGIRLLASMHFEMGAEQVILPFLNQPVARSIDDLKDIERLQTKAETLELFTVHLMGTARMGSRPEESVVDLSGQLWDLPGAYVADASLFPTAIGVNPQITIMALATRIAGRLIDNRGRVLRAA
ncbi:MAG: GMC family oxidoreductase [Myxococcales bacterium]|nr:GMC family oxidoreductase [Myxococcales bacterium]